MSLGFCLHNMLITPSGVFLVSSGLRYGVKCWEERKGKKGERGKLGNEQEDKRKRERKAKKKGKKKRALAHETPTKDILCSGSSYLPTRSPSGSSLSLPHPHSSSPPPSLSSARCSSHPRVATLVIRIKSCSIVVPLGVKRRECSVVSLVIPACCLLSWYSLQPRSGCLTLWTLSEHWHCVESYAVRRIRKGLKYPCPSRSWWIVEAVVWSLLVMSFVGFQLGPQSFCLWAMLRYPCPLTEVVHICCHSLRPAS